MASVSKRKWTYKGQPREAWVVRYRDRGGAHRSRQFDRKKEADDYRRKVENEMEAGTHVARGASITVSKLLDEYIGWIGERFDRREVGFTFYDGSKRQAARVAEFIGQINLTELSWQDVTWLATELRSSRFNRGKGYAPGTINLTVGTLGHAIAYGMRRGYVARNAVAESRPEIGSLAGRRIDTFQAAQVQRLFSAIEAKRNGYSSRDREMMRAIVYIAACCGLRRGEILGLGLDVIDFDRGLIHVKRSLAHAKDLLKLPKTASGIRSVPMPAMVAEAIRAFLPHAKPDERGLIFRSQGGKRLSDFDNSWHRQLTAAGLLLPDGNGWYHFHALRHFAGSSWIAGGVPLTDVSRLLGHANVAITARIYSHSIVEPTTRAPAIEACAQSLLPPPGAQEVRKAA